MSAIEFLFLRYPFRFILTRNAEYTCVWLEWLSRQFYENERKTPSAQSLQDAIILMASNLADLNTRAADETRRCDNWPKSAQRLGLLLVGVHQGRLRCYQGFGIASVMVRPCRKT